MNSRSGPWAHCVSGTGKPILSRRSSTFGGRSAPSASFRACFSRPSLNLTFDGIVAASGGQDVAAVPHGLVLTLYMTDRLALNAEASYELWQAIGFPDVAIVDAQARRVERGFGARD